MTWAAATALETELPGSEKDMPATEPLWGGSPGGSAGKESTCSAGDPCWIPGLGQCPGEGIGYHSSIPGLPWWLRW